MSRYSSSVSKNECPASVWATITAGAGNGGGGGSGPAPTGNSEGGSGGTKPNGAPGFTAPAVLCFLALSAGVLAVVL